MTSTSVNETAHVEAARLLPWFANGTLDAAEQDRVHRHLDSCVDCSRDFAELKALRESIQGPAVSVLVPKPNAEEFLDRLDRPRCTTADSTRSPQRLLLAASVAALAIAAGLYWAATRSQSAGNTYVTATAPAAVREFDYVLALRLASGTSAGERADLKKSLGASALNGPDEGGGYRLEVRLPAYSLSELDEYCRKLETHTAIISAEAVALQLPINGNGR